MPRALTAIKFRVGRKGLIGSVPPSKVEPKAHTPGLVLVVAISALAQACGVGESLDTRRGEIVYGADGRTEYFDIGDDSIRAQMSQSVVALIPTALVQSSPRGLAVTGPTWGERDNLCAGERFADEPAAAFCSGVLVDWNLVLTAGHCARLFSLDQFRVVSGYYYVQPDQMARLDAVEPAEIVDEELDSDGAVPQLDYAWLRLTRNVESPAQPAPIYRSGPILAVDQPIVSISAIAGVPLKLDAGGVIRDPRPESADYFVADTDTSGGSSGGGAFDDGLALVGILARGESDLTTTDAGCSAEAVTDGISAGGEQYTYLGQAVGGLCGSARGPDFSICRADCDEPCTALPPVSSGCSVASAPTSSGLAAIGLAILALASLRRPRRWNEE